MTTHDQALARAFIAAHSLLGKDHPAVRFQFQVYQAALRRLLGAR